MSLSKHDSIQEFLNYLAFQKRYSPHTLTSYQNDLEAFFAAMEHTYAAANPADITTPMIRTWLATLKGDQMNARSINRKISCLKSFFKYLLKREAVVANPAQSIPSLKISKHLPSFIEADEVLQLLNPQYFTNDFTGSLHRLILLMLYHTGVRRNELLTLQRDDIDFANGTVKVLGKGNKERVLPVAPVLLKELKDYLELVQANGPQPPCLLVTEKGRPLYPKYIYNVVNTHIKRVSTVQKKSPHTLRHTFATHLTNRGAQINAIKELLGHSSLAATQIYTHNSIERLKEVHKNAHPKS